MTDELIRKLDLIAEMIFMIMGRNIEISFGELHEFEKRYKEIENEKS